jgi:hypothetical protein
MAYQQADMNDSDLQNLRAYWETEECLEALYCSGLCTNAALQSAKKLVDTPIQMDMKKRKIILVALGVLARCADRQYYHEHWFELGALLDAATAALPKCSGVDSTLLAAAVYNLTTKRRHGEACEPADLQLAVTYLRRASRDADDSEDTDATYNQDAIGQMEQKVLTALSWELPAFSSFSTLSMLFRRLAVFTRRPLDELDAAWEVAVHLIQDLALAGRFDYQVTLGAFLVALLQNEFLTLEDVLVDHDHEAIVLASATNALGATSTRPRYTNCVKQAARSSIRECHAALLSTLRELVTR